jgi:hypothetical protein
MQTNDHDPPSTAQEKPSGVAGGSVRDQDTACQNTDREIWREREGDYYADSIFVTEGGGIGINCGGFVHVKPIRSWHALGNQSFAIEKLRQLVQYVLDDEPNEVPRASSACRGHLRRELEGLKVWLRPER